ncbi:adapter molecule Crk-like isoform X2 [Tubulanus polymorphus]|uniref:adapter molecule Crk-like isoform X2 n=1 Tax=Tubulanus polymorphus TaxID=672921 RepID=UPI003DA46EA2
MASPGAVMFDFDPENWNSWYFGPLGREETNVILNNERDTGVFLVRDSGKFPGDFVLCVKEDSKISHYIINTIEGTTIRIGDQDFQDLPSLLAFYKKHYLDTTPLVRPDPEDLPFQKGDILDVITKDEKEWWTARNSEGKTGSIPVPYVQKYDSELQSKLEEQRRQDDQRRQQSQHKSQHSEYQEGLMAVPVVNGERTLPALARVIKPKFPSPYDPKQLSLDVDDIVKVLKMNRSGEWEGEVNGKVGYFPFTHIQFIDSKETPSPMTSAPNND